MSMLSIIRSSTIKSLSGRSGKSTTNILHRFTRSVQSAASEHHSNEYSFKKPKSYLYKVQPDDKISNFIDAMSYMNKVKDEMIKTNPFFTLLNDTTISSHVKLSFVPFMCGFTLGLADFATYGLQVDNDDHELTDLEKVVNRYVSEDDFQYNFYLRDLETLGTKYEDFGTHQGAIRHFFSPEAACGRRVNYALAQTIGFNDDTRLRLLAAELAEAGLVGLFRTLKANVLNGDTDLPMLEYFDNNDVVDLKKRASHFDGKETANLPENSWMHQPMTDDIGEACEKGIVLTLSSFDQMYKSFHHVIISTQDGFLEIKPESFTARGVLPMANILGY